MATAPVKTPNDWLAILSSAGKRVADEVPTGFKTSDKIAEEPTDHQATPEDSCEPQSKTDSQRRNHS
jgi:hypothetical protein